MLTGRILLTGGSGTLGKAIIRRATREKWDCQLVIFSTDAMKHIRIKSQYPNVQSIIGDIRDSTTLHNAMVGSDYVLHLAAVKHIPVSEYNSIDTFDVNVSGSLNVCVSALQLGIPHVLGISTDKACSPANAYGATKMLTEKVFQEYSRLESKTQFHLVRYGNVLESTGSVVEAWRNAVKNGTPVKVTDPAMTRFWLSPSQAVDYVIDSLCYESGQIYIPRMPGLDIGTLLKWVVDGQPYKIETVPLRPGEKMHECLLTEEETHYAQVYGGNHFLLNPTTSERHTEPEPGAIPYFSNVARDLTEKELWSMLEDE